MKKIAIIAALLTLSASAQLALAQAYPTKPIRMLIGFPPGGGTDIIGRIVAQKLGDLLGQQVIVDNRGGASGQLAAELVAKAPPDGYTIMMAHIAAIAILPSLMSKLPYDAQKDFAPVSLSAIGPNLLVVHPSVPAKSVKELIALAKAKPGQLQYASPGAGTVQHLAGELFKLQAGVDMLHVPYKGAAPAVIAAASGQVPVIFSAYPSVSGQMNTGKLRGLAVTSTKRIAAAPALPTVAEAALPGFESTQWWGFYGPAGLPAETVARLNREMNAILGTADTRKRLAAEGAEPAGGTPADLAAHHKADYARWEKVIHSAGIKGE